ncbi:hypothetical protein HK098_005625 [Nowakowskiella sp. JEL0407]|nr:hypothetical protein HK098_005625 [Nowakowskiella sp. JEL0407]
MPVESNSPKASEKTKGTRLNSEVNKEDIPNDSSKRLKSSSKTKPTSTTSAFSDGLFDRAPALAKEYIQSKPYLHTCISNLVNDELLHQVRKEILSEIAFTAKETDIYKVNQTGDLRNLDGLDKSELKQLPSVFKLRNAIYSPEFRDFVSAVTGCGPLSGSVQDLSINNYTDGCHLLCHDDVIGTRRVSYILYLVDEDWTPEDGGALELYPVVSKSLPDVLPSVTIQTRWNQFIMFTVQPGASYHSVQEVVTKTKQRLSISGWFHFPLPNEPGYVEGASDANTKASLMQLEDSEDDILFTSFPQTAPVLETLSHEDIEYLKQYINPEYLTSDSLSKISDKFSDESCIQLLNFLRTDIQSRLHSDMVKIDQMDGYADKSSALVHGVGVSEPWHVTGDPVKNRYLTFDEKIDIKADSPQASVARILQDLQKKLFQSTAFQNFLSVVSSMQPTAFRGLSRRFRPGLDYTLATTSNIVPVLDTTLCFAVGESGLWQSQDYGGYECYVAADDGDFDPAVYRGAKEDEGALITAAAAWNSMMIVLRDEDVLRFVKYVSARAPGSRWDVSYEYDVRE